MANTHEALAMLGNQSLWDATREVHHALQSAVVPHAIVGGLAVCLHGYQRNTVDLDLLVRPNESENIRSLLEAVNYRWFSEQAEFRSPHGIPVHCVLAGQRAGTGSEVCLPDPSDAAAVTRIEGFPVLTLAKLIEAKIACGEGSPRRIHRDFADVVELIAKHQLSRSFASKLHKSLRPTFRKLVLHSRGES